MKSALNRIFSTILLTTAALAAGCASSQRSVEGTFPYGESDLSDASPQEVSEFGAIERTYKQRQWDTALKKTRAFISQHPKSAILDQVYFVRGLAYLGLKQNAYALICFKHVIALTDQDIIKNMALYNKAFIESEQSQNDEARTSLDAVRLGALPEYDRSKFFVLLAKVNQKRGDSLGAAQAVLNAFRYKDPTPGGNPTLMGAMENFLVEQLAGINSLPAVERLVDEFSDLPQAHHLLHRAAELSMASGDPSRAKAYAERLLAQHPSSSHAPFAQSLLRQAAPVAHADTRTNPARIGVLLTLSGKFSKFGYKTLRGIELALGVFVAPGEKIEAHGLTLVIQDDRGEEEGATRGVEELVAKHEVAVIIGPLLSKLGDAAGRKADELGVPLISLTQKEAAGSEMVFNAALTPEMQIRELVRVARDVRGAKDFAVLAPSSKFGREYSRVFWNEVQRTGERMRGYELYPADETDFRTYIDSLVGLTYPDARGPEIAQLNEMKAASQLKLSNKRMSKMFSLKPIVDFDAVFIPDDPKSLGQILPTFAYKDVEKTLFLGVNTWNTGELLTRAAQYAEGAIFVDAYFPGSQQPGAIQFQNRFQAVYGSSPSSMEAIAYDAANIVASIMRGGASSRGEIRDRLRGLREFPGVMGKITYEDGRLTKRLAILTVKGGKIEEIAERQ